MWFCLLNWNNHNHCGKGHAWLFYFLFLIIKCRSFYLLETPIQLESSQIASLTISAADSHIIILSKFYACLARRWAGLFCLWKNMLKLTILVCFLKGLYFYHKGTQLRIGGSIWHALLDHKQAITLQNEFVNSHTCRDLEPSQYSC